MLVDNPLAFYSPPPPTTANEADLSEFLNTDLFGPSSSSALPAASASTSSASPGSPEHSASTSSRESSPSISLLTTPPQQPLQNSFPEIHADDPYGLGSATSFLNFLNDDWKMDSNMGFGMGGGAGGSAGSYGSNTAFNPFLPPTEYDLISALTGGVSTSTNNPVADVTMASAVATTSNGTMAIDPQLVGSPTESGAHDDHDSDEEGEGAAEKASAAKKASSPEPVMTITPVKVGGHGKARKGTVQGGGITKKHTASPAASAPATITTPSVPPPTSATKNKENVSTKKSTPSVMSDDKDDDDDLPADWRPPPEVFQKMTSKEKRQLRNKISARNFRVRRKEYISTLEMDIAERDRLLQAIRSELGSTQSENLALRQEIAGLKKALLEGRHINHSQLSHSSAQVMVKGAGDGMNMNLNAVNGAVLEDFLPPPAPLPERSAADEILARTAATPSPSTATPSSAPNAATSSIVTPNTQKDISSSQAAFWGGVGGYSHGFGIGGGVTPVHTVLMPEISSAGLRHQQQEELNISRWVRDVLAAQTHEEDEQVNTHKRRLQENMNPALNEAMDVEETTCEAPEFEQFVESNTFTMKSIDAYRMHLWTKMAASHTAHPRPVNPNPKSLSPPSPPLHAPTPSPPTVHKKYSPDRITSPSPFAPLPSQAPSSPPSHYLTSPHLINPKASLTGRSLASQLKPHYFVSSQKANLPPSSPTPGFSSLSKVLGTGFLGSGPGVGALGKKPAPSTATAEQQQQIMYAATATLASQTLLGKLGGAFWDAFSGGSGDAPSPSPLSSRRSWDADKVRKVLEGKAVVKVVDVDEPQTPVAKPVTVKTEVPPSPVLGPSLTRKEVPGSDLCHMLEEKMKSLTLAKKN
ncbi:hypothetical protein PQX77_021273 [Marasmius sp. AFHP31]|nr:hypothetical protein PQX77_021273 [Marasmius sp. AFHP31]